MRIRPGHRPSLPRKAALPAVAALSAAVAAAHTVMRHAGAANHRDREGAEHRRGGLIRGDFVAHATERLSHVAANGAIQAQSSWIALWLAIRDNARIMQKNQ